MAYTSSQTAEEEQLGLEGDASERATCMRDKAVQPNGLVEFATKLHVDNLVTRGPLKGAECEREHGCGVLTLKPQPQEGKPCVREVPKLIHFVWLDNPIPERYAKNIADVMKVNSDYQILLWVNEAGKDVSALTQMLDAKGSSRLMVKHLEKFQDRFRNWDIIEKVPNVGARSDWIRLEVMLLYGGIYMDTDAHAFHGFSEYGDVFRWPFVAYSDPKGYGNLCNCVFSAEKQSPLVNLTIEGWRDANLNYNIPSGPPFGCGVLTSAFVTYNQPEILMLPWKYMFQKEEGVDAVMTTSFDGSWIEKGMWGRKEGPNHDPKAK